MGEVCHAQKGELVGATRICVLKTLRGDLAHENEYVRRFLDEARVVVTLQHAAIAHVFDVGIVEGTFYFAMEHIPGLTLRAVIEALVKKAATMPPALAVH